MKERRAEAMGSEALYEQYKDALKRGHVASLRGRIEEALIAYAEAARIAPERSTPHTSAGTALLRRKRPSEALRSYDVALAISPREEAALLGRAQALAAMDRRGDAADAFDQLADVQAGGGRLADAVDAARRGLELAEGRDRRRTLERLIARLRATEPDEPGRLSLERALQILEGPAVPATAQAPTHRHAPSAQASGRRSVEPEAEASGAESAAEATQDTSPAVDVLAADLEPGAAPSLAAELEPEPRPADAEHLEPQPTAEPEDRAEPPPTAEASEQATPAAEAEGEPASGRHAAPAAPAARSIPADATVADLAARAELAIEAGQPQPAVEAVLDLAGLHAREGRIEAALDACYSALSIDPDSVALHLALVELYSDRGWDALAVEKLDLLERLARLDGDDTALADIAGTRAARG